jgi:MoaD family protein
MEVKVKLFSYLRQVAGTDQVSVRLDEGARVADLLDALDRRFDNHTVAESAASIMIDHRNAEPETLLKDGDEVLLLPIIGGG